MPSTGTYLYDPTGLAKVNVAVSYNDRCYMYMQMGGSWRSVEARLHSIAPSSCSIPDAYRKQQELVKRLGPLQADRDN